MPDYPSGHSYASNTEFTEAGLPAGAIVGLSSGMITRTLERASRVADTYLRDRYKLPLSDPYDPSLVDCVCQIAAWRLMQRRGFNPNTPGDAVIRVGYEDAIAFLKRVSNGQAQLDVVQSAPNAEEPIVSSSIPRGYSGDDNSSSLPFVGPNGMGL